MPGLLDVFASPKAALLRSLGLPLLVLAAGRRLDRLAREGVAALRPRDAGAIADAAAIAWALVACASAVTGMSPRTSVFGEIGQREGLLTTLSLVGLWFGVRASHREPAHERTTLAVAFASAGLAALVALAQFAGLDPLVWENPARYAGIVRPPGTLGNPILLGVIMAAVIAGGVAALARARSMTWLIAPSVAVMAAALVATLSRGAWLAAAAGLAMAAAPLLLRPSANGRGRAVLALGAALVPAIAFGALAVSGPVLARVSEGASTGATSSPARAEIALGAFQVWRSHPWLGTGPDTFGLAFTSVQSPELWRREWFGLPLHAHSAVLQVLATLGAAGALVLAVWAAATLRSWRSSREGDAVLAPVLVTLAIATVINPLGLAGTAVLIVASALVVNGATRAGDGPSESGDRSRNAAAVAAVVAVLVGALSVAVGARELSTLADAGRARAALLEALQLPPADRGAAFAGAERFARRARLAWPADDELARLECDAILARVDALRFAPEGAAAAEPLASEAVEVARIACRAVPLRAANHQRLADALAARARIAHATGRDDPGPAIIEMSARFTVAEGFAPADGLLLVDRARAELSLGLIDDALATASRIVKLYPEAAIGHALEGAAHLMRNDGDGARTALRRALDARWEEGAEAQREQVKRLLEQLGPAGR